MPLIEFFTIKQLATRWKLHSLTVRRYIRERKLTATKVGGRLRISTGAVSLMEKNFQPQKHSKPHHLQETTAQTFSEADPIWHLKGLGATKEL